MPFINISYFYYSEVYLPSLLRLMDEFFSFKLSLLVQLHYFSPHCDLFSSPYVKRPFDPMGRIRENCSCHP